MDIFDISELRKDESGMYDLTERTFQLILDGSIRYAEYIVQKGEEMRIDLVCQSIYNNTNYVDIILNVNNIDNPLNIKEGTRLIYPINDIDSLRYSEPLTDENITPLGNSNKSTKKDVKRKDYIKNGLSLPPTILEEGINVFNTDGDKIILGDGLF
jgi:hypothetical protein